MSENRSRGIRDFSTYDAMTTAELEEILRTDTDAPVGEESDIELILHVMEVLANRRNAAGRTGKTAEQAWETFERYYLPEAEEEKMPEKKRPVRHDGRWLRRLISSAAAVVLVVCIPLAASAFGWKDVWNAVAKWAKETFSFVSGENAEYHEPSPDYKGENVSFQEFLDKNKVDAHLVPSWLPDGYVLKSTEKDISPIQEIYTAYYTCGDKELRLRVQTYPLTDALNIEIEEDILETYLSADTVYYIFPNEGQIQVVWVMDSYECCISGDISLDEAKKMIDSVEKG